MACDTWKAKLDAYVDGELPDEEMRSFDEHVRGCRVVLGGCARARADEAGGSDGGNALHAKRRVPPKDGAPDINRSRDAAFSVGWAALAAAAMLLVAGRVDLRLSADALGPKSSLQRGCRSARRDAGQLVAGRCCLDRQAHGQAMVPGKNSVRVQSAGAAKHRLHIGGRPRHLSGANSGRTVDLRRAEAPHLRVYLSGSGVTNYA